MATLLVCVKSTNLLRTGGRRGYIVTWMARECYSHPPFLHQGQRVHARVNRELNLTSLESPREKALPCDITVLEQGWLWLTAAKHSGYASVSYLVGLCGVQPL